jgi:hypothetical protein
VSDGFSRVDSGLPKLHDGGERRVTSETPILMKPTCLILDLGSPTEAREIEENICEESRDVNSSRAN